MRLSQTFVLVASAIGMFAPGVRAGDPVVVELTAQVNASTPIVAVADVARLMGGNAATRERIARLDIVELKPRDQVQSVTRQAIEYRLLLAGIEPAQFRITGAESTVVTASRRTITAEDIVKAAREEILRRLASPPGKVLVELSQPIAVKLPEVFTTEAITITAQPHARTVGFGRNQMDVVISTGTEKLLSFFVLMEVKSLTGSETGVVPVSGSASTGSASPSPAPPSAPSEVLVRQRQRVTMQVRSGALSATAVGEAQQDGRLGQNILVQNVDSKKIITARVTGPSTVEVEIGGAP